MITLGCGLLFSSLAVFVEVPVSIGCWDGGARLLLSRSSSERTCCNADNNAARNSASDFSFGVSISSLWAGLEVALQANASDLAEDCNCDLARYLFGSSGARPGEFSKMVPVFKENVGREWPV